MYDVIYRNKDGAIAKNSFSKLFIDTNNRPYILYGGWVNNIPTVKLFESEDLNACADIYNRLNNGDRTALIFD